MKRNSIILTLILIISLVFSSVGYTTSIRMNELTDGTNTPPTTSWYLIGYYGDTAYRMTYLSLLGVYFDAPGEVGGILYSNGNDKWERVSSLTSVTIGGFAINSAICSDSSGNLVGCTNISGDINFAPVASPTFTGTVTLPASTSLTTPVIGAATGTSLYTTGRIDGTVAVTRLYDSSSPYTVSADSNKTHYYLLNSTSSTFQFNLPVIDSNSNGVQYCFKNVGYSAATGRGDSQITIQAPTSTYIDLDGQLTSNTAGTIYTSGDAIGAGVCVISWIYGTDYWYIAFPIKGTWNKS